jgi:O-antigen ligase
VAAIGALVIALVVLFALWLRSWLKAVGALLIIVVVAGAISIAYAPLQKRVVEMRDALARRDYEALSAARMIPFFAAAEMVRDHPVVGVGPGCFSYNFFEYKLGVQKRHRWLFGPTVTAHNFGEVHNDHLQVASETGIPGYALFIAALALIAAGSRERREGIAEDAEETSRSELVRLLSLPLAVSLFVLALAQFPLELVAPTHSYLWAAAAVMSWRRS